MEQQNADPNGHKNRAGDLAHVEGPGDVRDVVEEEIR